MELHGLKQQICPQTKEMVVDAGTTTAGFAYGGNADPTGTKVVEGYEWIGSSWTETT